MIPDSQHAAAIRGIHARWLVVTALLCLLCVWVTYDIITPLPPAPATYPTNTATRPVFPVYAYDFLAGRYHLHRLTIKAWHRDNCLGALCDEWIVQVSPETLNVFIRCYLETERCVVI
jgi:hypothetical protein